MNVSERLQDQSGQPPQQEAYNSCDVTSPDDIDSIKHLRTTRPGERLTQGKGFLILCAP